MTMKRNKEKRRNSVQVLNEQKLTQVKNFEKQKKPRRSTVSL